MKKEFRLTDKDILSDNHFPIRAVFNSISDSSFIDTLTPLGDGVGFGVEYGACLFSSDLDEYDIATIGTFDGVQFGLHNGEEVTVDYHTFYYYFKKVCDSYIKDFPKDEAIINEIIVKFKLKFNI